MNEFVELEADLKKLRPAPVSADLVRRIERALEHTAESPTAGVLPRPAKRANGWLSFGLGIMGVAALLIIGLTFFDQTPQTPTVVSLKKNSSAAENVPVTTGPGFQPAGLTQVVYRRRDEGLVFLPNELAAPL